VYHTPRRPQLQFYDVIFSLVIIRLSRSLFCIVSIDYNCCAELIYVDGFITMCYCVLCSVQYKLQLDFDARVRHLKDILSQRTKVPHNCVRLQSAIFEGIFYYSYLLVELWGTGIGELT